MADRSLDGNPHLRSTIILAIVVTLGITMFPPWVARDVDVIDGASLRIDLPLGVAPLWSGPSMDDRRLSDFFPRDWRRIDIDYPRLFLHWLIGFLTVTFLSLVFVRTLSRLTPSRW